VLNRLQGLPAVLAAGPDFAQSLESFGPGVAPAGIPLLARRSAWTERRDLLALSERLVLVADEMDVDVIWLMNAAGDCVAASNFAVEAAPARFGEATIPISASFGIACWKSATESPDALLQRADAALYEAKAAGRNRVVVAGDAPAHQASGVRRQASGVRRKTTAPYQKFSHPNTPHSSRLTRV
jgi:hypothetical protein